MRQTLKSERIPIKLWLDDMEESALQQAKNLANLPFAFHHISIMPDAHFGYGMPIGGILAADAAVVPNAVGVDIGCGMCAVKTSLHSIEQPELKRLLKTIRAVIPRGFKHHKKPLPPALMPVIDEYAEEMTLPVVEREYQKARTQIGTLGGGNHFIEIQQGRDGAIWFMIHSGSRNLGFQVANHYNKRAVHLSENAKHHVPRSWQLASLSMEGHDGRTYFREMTYCVAFAKANRMLMRSRVEEALLETVSPGISFSEPINIAHNYAACETHYGKNVYIHRKGATRAQAGETGIIPGSQGSASFIVSGRGNPDSFSSCSHGAGRRLGRKQARRELDLEQEKRLLEKRNILHAVRGTRDLEEAAGAYKDIDAVIEAQRDLIEIVEELHPLAVIKG